MHNLTQEEVEQFKQDRWFIIHHRDACTMCEKVFEAHEESFFGHDADGNTVYVCEKCSKVVNDAKMYTNSHRHPNVIPAADAKLWRYMDLAKFLSMLEDSALFFTRLDHFVDKFEGTLGVKSNEKTWQEHDMEWRKRWIEIEHKSKGEVLTAEELEKESVEKFEQFRKNIANYRTSNYVSCWHQTDTESEAMWQLYTRDTKQGIAIQTTFERLYQALPAVPQPNFGLVRYVDYSEYNNGTSGKQFHIFQAPWYKRKSFEHEKEFRVIVHDDRKPGFRDWNKKIRVDLNFLIENIYVSPDADEWFVQLLNDILRNRYHLYLRAQQSQLNELPFI